ncbi:MAG: nucleoside-diphosphate sugar epimerase/dehydratase, partial [Candidatus Korobacteraceae bacterium]
MAEAEAVRIALPRKLGLMIGRIPEWFFSRTIQILLDGSMAVLAVLSAYMLRFDCDFRQAITSHMLIWIPLLAMLRPMTVRACNGYDTTWRFFHLRDAVRLSLLAVPVSILLALTRWLAPRSLGMPNSIIVLEFGMFVVFASGLRVMRRITYQASRPATRTVNTLLVGDDSSLASAIRHVELFGDVKLIGLLCEDESLHGLRVGGIPVLGSPKSLPRLLASLGIELVIVSGAESSCVGEIVAKATEFGTQVRILPSARDLVNGSVRVSRTVAIDQISHKRIAIEAEAHPAVVNCLRQRAVLITGAGGSIGSELARQVAKLPISKLIILDQDENSIFELTGQLRVMAREKELVPFVGDIRDRAALQVAFSEHRPEVVLHAAAYKHVPVMESNCCEAVLNNVFGTRQLVEAAVEFGCERFVMISTDKAVRPSSVMGATKRAAEILVQLRAAENSHHKTSFACVRFGNVLGSRGSVVPIFLRQIAAGGPVTITHEEMTRYFMTIPQAVQLVLQAASLASSGDVYMLDMGDPVKIIDFAKELIQLSGFRPGKDIAIKVVGMRPGEKLHEQLWLEDAKISATDFPYVFRV